MCRNHVRSTFQIDSTICIRLLMSSNVFEHICTSLRFLIEREVEEKNCENEFRNQIEYAELQSNNAFDKVSV